MPRTCSTPERNLIKSATPKHFLKVEILDTDSTWRDFSSLAGVDWLDEATWGETPDRPISTGTLTLRRDTDSNSLAPTIGASTINRNAANAYVPLLRKGATIRIHAAITSGAAPTTEWKEMGIYRIDGINWHQNPITIDFSDIGAWIQDAFLVDEQIFANEPGVDPSSLILLKQVVQNVLAADSPIFGGAPAVYEPVVAAWAPVDKDQVKRKSKLEIARDYVLQIGWDLRYRYASDDVFRFTLFEPDRSDMTPDWTIGPDEYKDVTNLETKIADIRNRVRVRYIDSDLNNQYVESSDADSIAAYGERFMEIAEDASSNIDSAGEALDLAHAAVHDLSDSPADQEIETLFFWPIQLGDVCLFLANGDHYDSDQTLAVTGYTHTFKNGEAWTTLQAQGRVIGAYRTWLNKGLTRNDTTTAASLVPELKNFRKGPRTNTDIEFDWENSTSVQEIWVYVKQIAQNTAGDPWDMTAAGAGGVKIVPVRLDSTTQSYKITYPPSGYITYVLFVPYDKDAQAGTVQKVEVLPVVQGPSVFGLTQQIGASGLFADVTALNVNDPQALGGRVTAWLAHDDPDANADPTGPADGYVDLGSTPQTLDATTTWNLTGGGTSLLLDNIAVHPGRGKRIAFEFVNSAGVSSGVQTFTLLSSGGIIDSAGNLLDASINRAEAFATTVLQPVRVLAALTDVAPDGSYGTLITAGVPVLYKRQGGVWTAVANTVDLVGQINTSQIADLAITAAKVGAAAVTTAKLAAAAVDASILATNAVTSAAIVASAITTVKIASGAVTATQIAANTITASQIAAGTITATQIAANTITAGQIAALTITAAQIAANTITASQIAANTITASQIAANTITASQLAANSVTASAISASAITSTAIAAGAVTSTKISVTLLSQISQSAGIIVSGKLQNAGGTQYLDLDAVGSNPFLKHNNLSLNADGSATFGGIVSSTAFTAINAAFSGNIGVNGNINVGTDGTTTQRSVLFPGSHGSGFAGISSTGTDLVLKGWAGGVGAFGNLLKGAFGNIPIPGVVIDSAGTGPLNASHYCEGDLWIDCSSFPGSIFVLSGGIWTAVV